MRWSDNEATNLLIRRVGREAVNRRLDALSLGHDAPAPPDDGPRGGARAATRTSRRRASWRGSPRSWRAARASARAREGPARRRDRRRPTARPSAAGCPRACAPSRKPGALEGVRCETAWVDVPGRPYAAAIMTAYLQAGSRRRGRDRGALGRDLLDLRPPGALERLRPHHQRAGHGQVAGHEPSAVPRRASRDPGRTTPGRGSYAARSRRRPRGRAAARSRCGSHTYRRHEEIDVVGRGDQVVVLGRARLVLQAAREVRASSTRRTPDRRRPEAVFVMRGYGSRRACAVVADHHFRLGAPVHPASGQTERESGMRPVADAGQ